MLQAVAAITKIPKLFLPLSVSVDKCRLGLWTQAPLLMYGSLDTHFAHLSRIRASKLGLLLPTDSQSPQSAVEFSLEPDSLSINDLLGRR